MDQTHLTKHTEGVLLQDHRLLCHSRSHPGQLDRQEEGTPATPGKGSYSSHSSKGLIDLKQNGTFSGVLFCFGSNGPLKRKVLQ